MNLHVAVVIPAHNEEKNIENTVRCFVGQSYPVNCIIVVDDCSTDGTSQILKNLLVEFPQLIVVTNRIPGLRAGAVNCGLRRISASIIDIVIVADADSYFDKDLVEEAVRSFQENQNLGGVCSIAGVMDLEPAPKGTSILKRFERWILWRIQRLEYAGFDAERTQTHESVLILHGLCSAYNLRLIKSLGGLSQGHLIEDYDLTLKIKEAGARTIFNPKMKAYTRIPEQLKALVRQRLRWMRGGVEVLMEHGYNEFTRSDFLSHTLFLALLLGIILVVGIGLTQGAWRMAFNFNPIPITLAVVGYGVSLYKLKFLERIDVQDVLIRIIIVPELMVAILMSGVQLYAYFLAFTHGKRSW